MLSRLGSFAAKALTVATGLGCLSAGSAPGATTRVTKTLETNRPATLLLESELGDVDLQDPRGYANPGAQSRYMTRRITIENIGTSPLAEFEFVVNGRDWRDLATITSKPDAEPAARESVLEVFEFWTSHRFHASAGIPAAGDSSTMFRLWGYTLCDEDTAALAGLLREREVPARQVPLNGHVAGEYFFDGKWNVLDGDQNAYYLELDNTTLASAEAIRRDPLLALRTKPFGRYAPGSMAHAYFNAALFEYVEPKPAKPIQAGNDIQELGHPEVLLPGERVIAHLDRWPRNPAGRTDLAQWPGAREHGLRLLEYVLRPSVRKTAVGGDVFRTRFPIVEESEAAPLPTDLRFEQTIPPSAPNDEVTVFAQRSKVSMPSFAAGENSVVVKSKGTAQIRVTIEYDPVNATRPQVSLSGLIEKPHGAMTFEVKGDSDVDRLWWQVSESAEFKRVHPSFDHVEEFRKRLRVDALTATFLNDATSYFIRVRGRLEGVWGNWSSPLEFRVSKPPQPRNLQISSGAAGGHVLQWEGRAGCEYLVFASDRLDFLPEIYAAEQPVSMRRFTIGKSTPNRNHVATVRESALPLQEIKPFYRVIAVKDGRPSVPSELFAVPSTFLPADQRPKVLQMRAGEATGVQTPEYTAEEMPLLRSEAAAAMASEDRRPASPTDARAR